MSQLPQPAGPSQAEPTTGHEPTTEPDPLDPTASAVAPDQPPTDRSATATAAGTGTASSTAAEATNARLVVGIALGVAAAALGGWILGEYPFTGVMPYFTGVLFALVVAEVMLSISRRPGPVVAAAACVVSACGIGLAVWIQSTEGLVAVPIGGWVAITLGAVVGLLRGGIIKRARPTTSTSPSS